MRRLSSRDLGVRVAVAAAAAWLCAGMAGCAGETEIDWPDDPPQSESAGPPPSTTDSVESQVSAEILSLIHEFRQVETAHYAAPQPSHLAQREFSSYLADPLLSQTLETLNDMREGGVAFEGTPRWAPAVAELRLDDNPPTATVHDCVDATGWRPVFQDSGEPVPGDVIPSRYVALIELKLYPDGWLVERIDNTQEEQC